MVRNPTSRPHGVLDLVHGARTNFTQGENRDFHNSDLDAKVQIKSRENIKTGSQAMS